jgi:hypothetical protein
MTRATAMSSWERRPRVASWRLGDNVVRDGELHTPLSRPIVVRMVVERTQFGVGLITACEHFA